jgi:hypothetical protein
MAGAVATLRLNEVVLAKVEKIAVLRNVKRGTVLRECVENHIDEELELLERVELARVALDEMKESNKILSMSDMGFQS